MGKVSLEADCGMWQYSHRPRARLRTWSSRRVSIQAAEPGNKYEPSNGTSLAAPVVTGVAAMLMSYFPNLKGADVRRILLETATDRKSSLVERPGMPGMQARFGDLSVTGGIVNAEAAVRAALR